MSSTSFRLISTAISTLLLAALVFVIFVAIRDNPSTALPSLATATADENASEQGDSIALSDGTATPASASETTPTALTETPAAEDSPTETPIPETATATKTSTSPDSVPPTDPPPTPEPTAMATQQATQAPTETPIEAPTATPTDESATASATTVTSPFARASAPTLQIYSNGNYANAVAVMRSTIWTATDGGVVAWNKNSGGYVKFTVTDGLSTNHTVAAAVCPLPGLGVLFGSDQGIQIFDTQNGSWKTLDSRNSDMRDDNVAQLWCNAADELLVVGYARQGIDILDASGDWTYIGTDEGLEVTGIRDLAVSADRSTLWLASNEGLFSLIDGDITRFHTENSPLLDNRIEAIALDGAGAVWLTSGDTLYRTSNDEWELYRAADATGSFPNGRLVGLDVTPDGALWLGSDQSQICRFDPGVKGCVSFYQAEAGMATFPLTELTIGSDGGVYYTTSGGGISILENDEWRQLLIEDEAVPGNSIRHLATDSTNSVWAATLGGVSRIDPNGGRAPQQFSPSNSSLPSDNVNVVLPNDNGVWIGAEGVSYFDGTNWTIYGPDDGLVGTNVQAIAADSQNRIWVGTAGGLSIWTGSTFFNLGRADGLPSDDITALLADENVMWIGTRDGGLLRFQNNQLQLFNSGNSNLPSNAVRTLARGQDGTIWIGTGSGIASYANDELNALSALSGAPANVAINALATADSGASNILWVATVNNELFRFDGSNWTDFSDQQRPGNQITSLLLDQAGELWLGTSDSGLARYTP